MSNVASFILGIPFLLFALWLLPEQRAKRIRQSRYWFVGWLAYLLSLLFAIRLMAPITTGLDIDHERAVPTLVGGVVLAALVINGAILFRLRREANRVASTHLSPRSHTNG